MEKLSKALSRNGNLSEKWRLLILGEAEEAGAVKVAEVVHFARLVEDPQAGLHMVSWELCGRAALPLLSIKNPMKQREVARIEKWQLLLSLKLRDSSTHKTMGDRKERCQCRFFFLRRVSTPKNIRQTLSLSHFLFIR